MTEYIEDDERGEDDGAYDRAIDEIIEAGEYRKGELDIHAALRRARNKEDI